MRHATKDLSRAFLLIQAFLVLTFLIQTFAAPAAEAREICPGGEVLWIFNMAVGCQFKLTEGDVTPIVERAPLFCKGTDHIGFYGDQLICLKLPYLRQGGLNFSDAVVGPDPASAEPAGLEIFDESEAKLCSHVDTGALAWWPLDGIDGAAERINGNRLTTQGALTATESPAGGGLNFLRSYAQSNRPLPISTGDFSIEAWVKTTQTSTVTVLDQRERRRSFIDGHGPDSHLRQPQGRQLDGQVPLGDGPQDLEASEPKATQLSPSQHFGYSLFIHRGKPGLQLADGGHTNYLSNVNIADGAWHHLAVTVDRDAADGIRWYVDGREALPRRNPTGRRGSLENDGPLRLGLRSFEDIGYFNGALDEVIVHGRILRPDEIATAAQAPRCKNAATQATCEFIDVNPPEPEQFQAVDFTGFVHVQPGCFYSWTWTVDGQIISHNAGVKSYTGLSEGQHLVCLQVTDDCSQIGCQDCRIVEVRPAAALTGNFCGRDAEAWIEDANQGKVTIINETQSTRRVIVGTDGPDLILGNAENNTIEGRGGDDCIYGFGGNDSIHGDKTGSVAFISGNDVIHGGPGNDHLQGDAGNDRLFGGAGNDYLEGDSGSDRLEGGGGSDRLHGDSGNDDLRGGPGHDCLVGDAGQDQLRGEAGNDDLKGDSGRDRLWGGPGRDALKGDSGRDQLHGGPGDDILKGDSSGDDLWGNEGNDRLCGDGSFSRRDQLNGGPGTDHCRSGRRSSCERTARARDCQTQDWQDWNNGLRCP